MEIAAAQQIADAITRLIEKADVAFVIPVDCAGAEADFAVIGYFIVPMSACGKRGKVVSS